MYELLKSQIQIVQSNADNVGPQARYDEIHSKYYLTQVSFFDCTMKNTPKIFEKIKEKWQESFSFFGHFSSDLTTSHSQPFPQLFLSDLTPQVCFSSAPHYDGCSI